MIKPGIDAIKWTALSLQNVIDVHFVCLFQWVGAHDVIYNLYFVPPYHWNILNESCDVKTSQPIHNSNYEIDTQNWCVSMFSMDYTYIA